ncbi:MAG: cytochrome c3 family protein [Desulfosarcina sp.]|nr:cytochrome c3 family protein [Desulfosarcina sp.]MBC2766768.1 cytochrome c3 family protein [Desulfosarcina sp.]
MSTIDEKAKEVMDDDAAHASNGKDTGASGFIILFFIIGFTASMVLGWVIFPKLLYSQKQQPFSFNHALHVEEVDEGCESCHFFREDGSFSGIPKVIGAKMDCVTCHGHIGESESSRPYEYNRITGYSRDIWGKNIAGFKKNSWDRMKMDDCAQCHKEAGIIHTSSVQTERDACFVCHK